MNSLKKKWATIVNEFNLRPNNIVRLHIEKLNNQLSVERQCKLLGISRSSVYYQQVPVSAEDLDLMNRIDKIHTDHPYYGARRISAQLRRETNQNIGRKKAGTLMEKTGIAAVYPKPKLSLGNINHRIFPYLLTGVVVKKPNQVWGADITYIRLRGGYLYLVAFMDWYSRYVLSWKLSNTLSTDFCLEAARESLNLNIPEIVNFDQGAQFTDQEMIDIWQNNRVNISMDHRGRCFDNIFTERLWRSVKYDEVYIKDYQNGREAYEGLSSYFYKYNYTRLHESLDYRTPSEVYFKS